MYTYEIITWHACDARAAFLANLYAKRLIAEGEGAKATQYQCWAMSQMRQIAGDGNRSYVIGNGFNPPRHSFPSQIFAGCCFV